MGVATCTQSFLSSVDIRLSGKSLRMMVWTTHPHPQASPFFAAYWKCYRLDSVSRAQSVQCQKKQIFHMGTPADPWNQGRKRQSRVYPCCSLTLGLQEENLGQTRSQRKTRSNNKSFNRCQAEPSPHNLQESLLQGSVTGQSRQLAEGCKWVHTTSAVKCQGPFDSSLSTPDHTEGWGFD